MWDKQITLTANKKYHYKYYSKGYQKPEIGGCKPSIAHLLKVCLDCCRGREGRGKDDG
jgi:hypothetical protein